MLAAMAIYPVEVAQAPPSRWVLKPLRPCRIALRMEWIILREANHG